MLQQGGIGFGVQPRGLVYQSSTSVVDVLILAFVSLGHSVCIAMLLMFLR